MKQSGDEENQVDDATRVQAGPSVELTPPVEKTEPTDVATSSELATSIENTDSTLLARQRTEAANEEVLAQSRRETRRSFLVAAAFASVGYGLYRSLGRAPLDQMQPQPIRNAFLLNSVVSRSVFPDRALAPTYPLSRAGEIRVNGTYGLKMALQPGSWRLQVVGVPAVPGHPRFSTDVTGWQYRYVAEGMSQEDQGHDTKEDPKMLTSSKMAPAARLGQASGDEKRAGRMPRGVEEAGQSKSTLRLGTPGLLLTLDDILALPRHEFVTEFKCIEGWSQIVHWAGVRMRDFLEVYPPALIDGTEPKYVYMETPDGNYYTSYDLNVLRHPQALLTTEMMGAPLTQYHGAPLRLHLPMKYGYKQIKRIGLIAYTNELPDDYWTKLGYDWYGGL
jgi:hypothetical protein